MAYFTDPHRIGPGYQPPGQRGQAEAAPVMTVAGRSGAEAPAPQPPKAETPAALAFQAYREAVDAQRDLNAEIDAQWDAERRMPPDERVLTEKAVRDKKAEIRTSPAARVVDMGEHAVLQRRAEADARYADLIAAKIQQGDSAQESRNTRFAQRIQRELDAAKSPGERVAVAQRMLEKADPAQLGVLVEELPSQFPDTQAGWLEAKLREIDPQLADAAEDCRRAGQVAAMSNYAASSVRHGFATGTPPTQISRLAAAVPTYDPDIRGG
jgi:hypothetical protein